MGMYCTGIVQLGLVVFFSSLMRRCGMLLDAGGGLLVTGVGGLIDGGWDASCLLRNAGRRARFWRERSVISDDTQGF